MRERLADLRWWLAHWPRGGDSRGLERLRHQVVERLTPQGKSLAALWLVLLAAAMVPRAPAGDLAFAVVSLALGSSWLVSLRKRRLQVRTVPPSPVREGEELALQVELRNEGKGTLREVGAVAARLPDALRPLQDGSLCGDLAPGAGALATLRFTALRRGRWSLALPLGCAQESLGLARMLVRPRGRLEFVIAPGALTNAHILPDPDAGAEGRFRSADLGELQGIRPWREGDRQRDLHHRAWARTGKPHVREREAPRPEGVWLAIDTGCRNLSERRQVEALLRLGLAWAEALEGRGRLGGLWIDGRTASLPEGAGRQRAMLEAFALPPSPGWGRWHPPATPEKGAFPEAPLRVVGVSREGMEAWAHAMHGHPALQVVWMTDAPEARRGILLEVDPTGRPAA